MSNHLAGPLSNPEDPRKKNHPLPNDAVMTYEYGARAYTHDLYPGFVWRNGFWYIIKPEMKFREDSERRIKHFTCNAEVVVQVSSEGLTSNALVDQSIIINDAYKPYIVSGVRHFILQQYTVDHHGNTYNPGCYIYFPHLQGVVYKEGPLDKYYDAKPEDEKSKSYRPENSTEYNNWSNLRI